MRVLFQLNHYNQQRQREKQRWIFPIMLAYYATALRNRGNEIVWDGIDDGSFDKIINSESQIDIPFFKLPHADRILTDALNPKWQNNGNFKYRPGMYIQSSNTCWYKKCSFCKETIENKSYELKSVNDVIGEIEECKSFKAKEVFDDSGNFPIDNWFTMFLKSFRNINGSPRKDENIRFSCNMRMVDLDYDSMMQVGFRMLLFGLESANQQTLNKINKGVKVEDYKYIIKAAKAGLEPHVTVMFGYPWETDQEALNTLKLVHYLLRKGYAKTAQASFYCPWDKNNNKTHRKYVKRIYDIKYSPQFWFNKLRDIHNLEDLKYLWRQIKAGLMPA